MKNSNHNVGVEFHLHPKKQITNKTNVGAGFISARQTKGITLIALIITIIVLLILAGVTISMLTGKNGILKNAQKAKEEYQIEKGMEQIQLVLGDDSVTRALTKEVLDTDRLIWLFNPEKRKWVVNVEKIEEKEGITIINDEGYMYDIIITLEGKVEIKYIGTITSPIIREIKIIDKGIDRVTIEVKVISKEEVIYKYSNKKENEEEYSNPIESKTNIYTYENLELKEIYNLKIAVESRKGKTEKTIDIRTGELEEGTITFTNLKWESGQASITINTREEGYTLQYQINGIENENWVDIENGGEVTGLNHKDTIYAVLYKNGKRSDYANRDIQDLRGPEVIIQTKVGIDNITANVIATDEETGMPEKPIYTFYIKETEKSDVAYEQIQTGENAICTKTGLVEGVSYTIKVEIADKAENKGIGTKILIVGLEETPTSYFTWTTTSTAATLTGLSTEGVTAYNNGVLKEIVISETYQELPVTAIGKNAFNGRTNITTVVIPDNVTSIGQTAFKGCKGITYLKMPISTNSSNVSAGSIEQSSFSGCTGITKVVLTKGTGEGVAYTAGSSTSGKDYAGTPWYQSRANKIEVIIDKEITSIGAYTFNVCTGIQSIKMQGETGNIKITNLVSIGAYAFNGCSNITGELEIPSTITNIPNDTFNGCTGITKLIIPDSVTSIGQRAFKSCSKIEYLSIPISTNASNVSAGSIEQSSFSGCTGITKVVLTKGTGEGVAYTAGSSTSGKDYAGTPWYQSRTNEITVTIEEGITSIGTYTFNACTGIKTVIIPTTLQEIETYSFTNCTRMSTIKTVEGIDNITFPSLTSIGAYAFSGCSSITGKLEIPSTITNIANDTFNGCTGITKLIIPDSVTSIGQRAFKSCSKIEHLSIPISTNASNSNNGSTIIPEQSSFSGCTGIKNIVLTKGTGKCVDYTASSASGKDYAGTPWYQSRTNEITVTIEEGIISIGTYTFNACTGIKTVIIPTTLQKIETYSFANCTRMSTIKTIEGIDNITFPSLISIGAYAFSGCSSITGKLEIPSTITNIANDTFNGCTGITKLIIPDSVTSIGQRAFKSCSKIEYLSIPISTNASNVSAGSIEQSSFSGCTGITKVVLTKGTGEGVVYTAGSSTSGKDFAGTPWYQSNGKEKTIILERGITSIGAYTFNSVGTIIMKYTGTEEEWNAITKGGNNGSIPSTIEYNATI